MLAHAPLATVVAITFAAPIFTCLFTFYLFGEVMNKAQKHSIVLGILGVVIVLRPSFEQVDSSGLLAALLGAVIALYNYNLPIFHLTNHKLS